jgi:hypothetical protein
MGSPNRFPGAPPPPARVTLLDPAVGSDRGGDTPEERAWRAWGAAGTLARAAAQRDENLLLQLSAQFGGVAAGELLDVAAATALDHVRFPGAPVGVLRASLALLRRLVEGVVLVSARHGALLAPSAAASGGGASFWAATVHGGTTARYQAPAPSPTPVDLSQDTVRLRCVRALLGLGRSGAGLASRLPALAAPAHGRLVSLLFGSLARLLFLQSEDEERRAAEAVPLLASALAAAERERERGAHGAPQRPHRAEGDWADFAAPLEREVGALREAAGLPRAPPDGGGCGGEALPHGAALPHRSLVAAALWMRAARGSLTAARSGPEFRLMHDWLLGAGAPGLLAVVGCGLAAPGAAAVAAVPLLRLLGEWANARGGRIHFCDASPGGFVLLRECARVALGAANALGLLGGGTPAHGGGAEEAHFKCARLFLDVAGKLLTGGFGNAAVSALYGDGTLGALWSGVVAALRALPTEALLHRAKLAREVFSAVAALASAPLPAGSSPHPHALRDEAGAASAEDVAALMAGAAPNPSPLAALSCAIPSPPAAAALALLPPGAFSAVLGKAVVALALALRGGVGRRYGVVAGAAGAGGGGSARLGPRALLRALEALEAVLTFEAECCALVRGITSAAGAAGAPAGALAAALGSPVRVRTQSAMLLSPAAAAAGAAAAARRARAATEPAAPPFPFGVDFAASLLLLGVHDTSKYAHAVARVLLPELLCRPAAFESAAAGVAAGFGAARREEVRARALELTAFARGLGDAATSNEGKHAFAKEFVMWAVFAGGQR